MKEQSVQHLFDQVLYDLKEGLSERLTYHSVRHTIDVIEQAIAIAVREGITSPKDILLLKVAALYHDTGFLFVYKGHEEESCRKARKELPPLGFTATEIDRICGMIMATKIPQQPTNLFEQILADADLDYLGRTDFKKLSSLLEAEFIIYGIIENKTAFEKLQLDFLSSHEYFTDSSRQLRSPVKKQTIEERLKNYQLHHSHKNNK